MAFERKTVLVAVLLVAVATAGCFGPDDDQAPDPEDEADPGEATGTTPGDTVEAGGQPTAEPDQTPTMFGTTTGQGTTADDETASNSTDGTTEAG